MSKSSIFAKVILLASAWMLALGADAVQPLARIDITNEVYTAAQTDEKISEAMAGIAADSITDGTNTLSANLDYEYEKVLTNTWVVNGIPYTTTTGYTYCSYFPPNPNENDIGYILTLTEGSSWESGYYDLSIGTSYWRNQGTEEDPNYQWVPDSGGMTGFLPANGTSFAIEGFVGTYPIKRMETSKLALTNDIPPAVQVVAPSTNAVKGTAADAKATGTALYTGFTEWVFSGIGYDADNEYSIVGPIYMNESRMYYLYRNGLEIAGPVLSAVEPPVELDFENADIKATRHLVTPTKTSQLTNDGTTGVPFALTTDIPQVVSPSTNAVAGTAADAKATGTALYTGFTEWMFSDGLVHSITGPFEEYGKWYYTLDQTGVYDDDEFSTKAEALEALSLRFQSADFDITATRHVVTPFKTSQLRNDGTNGVPFAQISDLNYEIVFSGGWLVSGSDVKPWHLYSVEQIDNDVYWTYILRENGIEISRADIGTRESSVDFSLSGEPQVNISAIYRGYALLSRKVNIINVSANATVAFPSNSAGESTDFYINMMVSDLQPQSVSFVDSNGNPISWVEPPPSTFSYGTNIIHIVEVSENTYSFSQIGTSDSGELTDVRIKGTLSQGHTTAIATGAFSNSQGTNTIASGVASHAEGASTTAEGNYAHSEGNGTYARGVASHSEGLFTRATERAAHSSGACALATNSWSFVWSGLERSPYYGSHGVSTFNVNPINGLYGFFLGEKTLEEIIAESILAPALVTNIVVAYDTGIEPSDDSTEPATGEVTVTYGTLRAAIATAVGETITNPMSQLGGMSLPEYISTVKKYEWDEARHVCYRRCISNDFIILTYATNIDLTAAENLSALKAYEDSIAVRRPPQVTSGYTVGYESASYSDKIIATGGDYVLEGSNLSGASVSITYDVSGTPTTDTIPDSSITTTTDTITIASAALANARSNGGTVTFAIQTAYGSTTATAMVASVSP